MSDEKAKPGVHVAGEPTKKTQGIQRCTRCGGVLMDATRMWDGGGAPWGSYFGVGKHIVVPTDKWGRTGETTLAPNCVVKP